MDQNGWNQKVEDGEGVRAMHIDAPDTDEGKWVREILIINYQKEKNRRSNDLRLKSLDELTQ